MDDIVKQAMAKWPHVPDCYGWLGLDERGNWYMRDEPSQRFGAFDSGMPGSKGAELKHEKLRAFIERNYDCDDEGCWYFQNGPQRVFVELQNTPWIWRVSPDGTVASHTGRTAKVLAACCDADGRLYVETNVGFGLIHTQDVWAASTWIETRAWPFQPDTAQNLDVRHGYVKSPALKRVPRPDIKEKSPSI